MKNPLGIIHSSAQYLVQKDRPREVRKQMLQYIMHETEHLNISVESLLSMARQPPPRFEQIDFSQAFPELVQRWIGSSDHNPMVKVQCNVDRYLPTMYGDFRQLSQMIINLVRNSEERMPEGGYIIVAAHSDGKTMSLRVEDNGPGIREEDMENVFKSFHTTKKGGLGLGLVVCQQIVTARKGKIGLDNNPTGGEVAWIKLPLRPFATSGLTTPQKEEESKKGNV